MSDTHEAARARPDNNPHARRVGAEANGWYR